VRGLLRNTPNTRKWKIQKNAPFFKKTEFTHVFNGLFFENFKGSRCGAIFANRAGLSDGGISARLVDTHRVTHNL
jgi:hypothetical protein